MEDNLYNAVPERLYERLVYWKDQFDLDSINPSSLFLMDQLQPQDLLKKLIKKTEKQFNGYKMSESQVSWAIKAAFLSIISLRKYNKENHLNLKPRP